MKLRSKLLPVMILMLSGGHAFATNITITITASLGPNPNGAPVSTLTDYTTNALAGLYFGAPFGNFAVDPTAFNGVTTIQGNDFMASAGLSWRGLANPTGAFTGQVGAVLYFGVDIKSSARDISLSQLSETVGSSDVYFPSYTPPGYFSDSYSYSGDSYSNYAVGYDALGGALTSPGTAGNTLVNEIVYRGVSTGFDASVYGNDQAALDTAIATWNAAFPNSITPNGTDTITACYSIQGVSNCQAVGVTAAAGPVPEPATFGMAGLAVAGLLFFRKKR